MKKRVFFTVLETLCRLGFGVLFVYSAWTKIADPDEFAHSVSRYQFLPEVTIGIFSLMMPMLELLAGLAILFTRWVRESALLISVMLAMFIVALAQALARGLEISCGCFGVPSVGGRQEILMALVRDVVLIVPAVWLMFRPNVWIEPLRRLPRRWRAICLWVLGVMFVAVFVFSGEFYLGATANDAVSVEPERKVQAGQGQGLVVSSGPIRPGEWNVDFKGVLAKAESEQRPMVLMLVGYGCQHCARLERSIAGEAFRLWREDRAPLMALVRDHSPLYSPETVQASIDFAQGIKKKLKGYPYVCVYWPQNGVTNRVAFCGRRGIMGGIKHKLLVMELMSALDRALGSRLTAGRKALGAIVKASSVRIAVRAEGTGGTVAMTPASGLLPEGQKVDLVARPDAEHVFLDWRRPDGSLAGYSSRLSVLGGMPVGCYTARFKSLSQCLPPIILSPAETTLCVRVRDPIRYAVKVSEECRPVSFKVNPGLPVGLKLNPFSGVVSGDISFPYTNTLTIAVVGRDPQRTEKTIRLTIATMPREGEDVKADDEDDDDDEEPSKDNTAHTKKESTE